MPKAKRMTNRTGKLDKPKQQRKIERRFEVTLTDKDGEEHLVCIKGAKTAYEFGLKISLKFLELGHLDAYISGELKQKYVHKGKLFKDVALEWYELTKEPKLRDSSRASYMNRMNNHLFPTFGKKHIVDITLADVRKFFQKRADISKSLNNQCKTIIQMVLSYAEENEYIDKNPLAGKKIETLGTDRKEKRAMLADEIRDALSIETDERTKKFIAIGLLTGMRIGEILGLRWEDYDAKRGILRVNKQITFSKADRKRTSNESTPKTKSGIREVPVCKRLRDILEPMRGLPKAHIITNELNLPERKTEVQMSRKLNALIGISPHEMRHTFITHMTAAGCDPKTVAVIVGHKTTAMTSQYTHPSDEMKLNAAGMMNEFLFTTKEQLEDENITNF